MNKLNIIILAAGQGTRMNGNQPKVLTPLNGETLIENLLKTIKKTEYDNSVSVVVGYQGEKVIERLGDQYNYIWQKEQLGTGHAVQQCESSLKGKHDSHLTLYGDMPFISLDTIQDIIKMHQDQDSVLTMVTLKLPNFEGTHHIYNHFGRIFRDENNEISKIIEFKDASEEEKKITELNPAIYCIQDEWLWENLAKIKSDNNQKEYYLTDLVNLAHQQKIKINSFVVEDSFELMGVNTKEDLELAQKIYQEKE
jgi:bifunctional UDP-N-acetylglucosamine pyrophosphorylase / glucosamine-1-phosphate N-acetyltransferase